MTATKGQRHRAILDVVNRGAVHTQQEIAAALARRGLQATQATLSRDIQELGLVRSGAGYRRGAALVGELVLSIEVVSPVAVIRTPPGTANLVARRIDEAALPGVAGTVAGDDTIIAVLRRPSAGRALKELLSSGGGKASPPLFWRARHLGCDPLAEGSRVGRDRIHGRPRREEGPRRHSGSSIEDWRISGLRGRRTRAFSAAFRLAFAPGGRRLRKGVPAGHRPRSSLDRGHDGRGRAARRRHRD